MGCEGFGVDAEEELRSTLKFLDLFVSFVCQGEYITGFLAKEHAVAGRVQPNSPGSHT